MRCRQEEHQLYVLVVDTTALRVCPLCAGLCVVSALPGFLALQVLGLVLHASVCAVGDDWSGSRACVKFHSVSWFMHGGVLPLCMCFEVLCA